MGWRNAEKNHCNAEDHRACEPTAICAPAREEEVCNERGRRRAPVGTTSGSLGQRSEGEESGSEGEESVWIRWGV